MEPKFKRILLKLSGEGLAGEDKFGLNAAVIAKVADDVAATYNKGVQICIVIGGGNFFRGAKNAIADMDRSVADHIGMLATIMNAMAFKSALEQRNCPTEVMSGLNVPQVCETYNFSKAKQFLHENRIIIFAGGTGCPYFTTDTGAVLRAVEMHCDILMKATQVDGVYDADPRYNPEAKHYDKISADEVITKKLNVIDMTAAALARDNNLPIMVFAQKETNSVLKAVCGEIKCTIIK